MWGDAAVARDAVAGQLLREARVVEGRRTVRRQRVGPPVLVAVREARSASQQPFRPQPPVLACVEIKQ